MAVLVRDQSRAGHVLGGVRISGLPDRITLADLIRVRVRQEVADYNQEPGRVFRGLVQPHDAVAHSDGFHLRRPRHLDAEHQVRAAEQAVRTGLLRVRIAGAEYGALDAELDLTGEPEVVFVKQRPVVATPP